MRARGRRPGAGRAPSGQRANARPAAARARAVRGGGRAPRTCGGPDL